jgi:hypothetical protein
MMKYCNSSSWVVGLMVGELILSQKEHRSDKKEKVEDVRLTLKLAARMPRMRENDAFLVDQIPVLIGFWYVTLEKLMATGTVSYSILRIKADQLACFEDGVHRVTQVLKSRKYFKIAYFVSNNCLFFFFFKHRSLITATCSPNWIECQEATRGGLSTILTFMRQRMPAHGTHANLAKSDTEGQSTGS